MKPVAIFRSSPIEGPGYLSEFLEGQGIPWQLIRIDSGDEIPSSISPFSGLVFMGGPMSVNDDLPWIDPAIKLIRGADRAGLPVMGHCLGGQLMSKAFGGSVARSDTKEFGWGEVSRSDNNTAREWFGDRSVIDVFHWHGEFFTLPEGAAHLLSSRYCQNQAFSMGKHLAMQFHIEMTQEMVMIWSEMGSGEVVDGVGPPVQSSQAMRMDLVKRVSTLNRIAQGVYQKWISGLVL
ncbi:MAG: type 1 glutamine amidotransferase [Nitrosomonadaceae bacterium]|nr:type 1 glutamine amidotransferase [Nitrosospira sp.]MDW7565201.1 type 1 glutamine amidotransferase [Nitrosomonadaceae bacterium]MBI0409361.1 type 1 glutamine amidotransferase [Nitrosospira sp.]MBI0409759.1 type 1 glutamine amidotransferase [Nitrosospira sp.]MBI0411138.1 type 1 glutamine amidotransferase [Nitrosospira sp.]